MRRCPFASALVLATFFMTPRPSAAELSQHPRLGDGLQSRIPSATAAEFTALNGTDPGEPLASPPLFPLTVVFVVSMVVLLGLILGAKFPAFLALLVASLCISVAATFVNPGAAKLTELGGVLQDAMGSSLGLIATVIGVGSLFGAILEISGGTQVLGQQLVKSFGVNRAAWAMLLTGFIISIPVFFSVGLLIMVPILAELAQQTGLDILHFGLPLVCGMATTHGFVPPTPGPIAVAAFLGVPLGYTLFWGIAVGLPTSLICGPLLCNVLIASVRGSTPGTEVAEPAAPQPDEIELADPGVESFAVEEKTKREPPGFSTILSVIALPIVFILTATVIEQVASANIPANLTGDARNEALKEELDQQPVFLQILHLLGNPIVALLVSTIVARFILGIKQGISKDELLQACNKSLEPAGNIILIVGAGGVFGGVLRSSGVTGALQVVFEASSLNPLVLAWLISAVMNIAQGSSTVAMVTAAAIVAELIGQDNRPSLTSLALTGCAVSSGSTFCAHVNDGGFWLVSRYMKMTEQETLRTWTVLTCAISLVSMAFILALDAFFG